MYPPAWIGPRRSIDPFELHGVRVPGGVLVNYCSWASHHLAEVFPEPFQFRPERFTEEARAALPKGAYIPFGGGSRTCIGMRFGLLEVRTIAAAIRERFSARARRAGPRAVDPPDADALAAPGPSGGRRRAIAKTSQTLRRRADSLAGMLRLSRVVMLTVLAVLVYAVPAVAQSAPPNEVVISEFRTRGPAGGNDEFVELRNRSASPVEISGWRLQGCAAGTPGNASNRATVGSDVFLPAGGSYLFANEQPALLRHGRGGPDVRHRHLGLRGSATFRASAWWTPPAPCATESAPRTAPAARGPGSSRRPRMATTPSSASAGPPTRTTTRRTSRDQSPAIPRTAAATPPPSPDLRSAHPRHPGSAAPVAVPRLVRAGGAGRGHRAALQRVLLPGPPARCG